MKVGIDKLGFYTPETYVDMTELANARGEEPAKYLVGIGQQKQAIAPVTQDVVTMAANAATQILTPADKQAIKMVLFGTESGVDNSKSTAVYLQTLLNLSADVRAVEIKQACYGATAGVQMACDYIRSHPTASVLVIGADIARYGLNTPGEVTQGAGAVAMLIKANPDLIEIESESVFHSADVMDFWRPLYRSEALVDGHYSNNVYIDFFNQTWQEFQKRTKTTINDFDAFLFHLPYTKMGLKALRTIVADDQHSQDLLTEFEAAKKFNAEVGNIYTGSLYLSLISWLVNSKTITPGKHVGFFSFGSGAQGEFFAGKVGPLKHLESLTNQVTTSLNQRQQVNIKEYESMFMDRKPFDPKDYLFDTSAEKAQFYLKGQQNNQLIYVDTKNK
ncbi:hydroxymethylglutaryl-CoA synthase [Lentilactobacillus senioris]|uniref:hydroxymethylglutaryl-CoA synthase n=1 Tax=Lentilactobacillus senioris TaxID=931534 RepID=UPI0022813DED|nr:hydroxymethylglutaryl-CoA synthase [Lentilactobacillus senioris]MCY9806740.1 hydroxymethylglutaryl-CoA synthase [Lentilactobacillus senioris]